MKINYYYYLIFFFFLASNTFGQTIHELEYDLTWYSDSEEYGDKIETARKLQKIDPFNYAATLYICSYYDDRNIDSVSIYFDNLIAKFPKNAEPFLLRAELLSFELDYYDKDNYNKLKVKYLKQALDLNLQDDFIIFQLAKVYYNDFIFPLEKKKEWGLRFNSQNLSDSTIIIKEAIVKKSTFQYSADSALIYFYKLWDLRMDHRNFIYFPIRQLECYLEQNEKSPIPNDFYKNLNQCFFPSSYFVDLNENWQCDFSTNYLNEIGKGIRTSEWLKIQLTDLNENCLYDNVIPSNKTIYRFTWLRSFNHPIVIRIEKIDNKVMLYWKVGKGAGGYEPRGLKKSGKKKISSIEWIEFERLINESNFDTLPNNEYIPMTDGATWTLEKKTSETFKAHNTNFPSKRIKEACLFLIKLTNIKIKDDEIY